MSVKFSFLLLLTACHNCPAFLDDFTDPLTFFGLPETTPSLLQKILSESQTRVTTDVPSYQTRINDETRLIKDLFGHYDSVARPVLNMSKTVEVKFAFILLSIQLNEVDQLLTSFVWLPHQWMDERLTWIPTHYGNITKLIIPNKLLWLPDTFLYQSSDDSGYVSSSDRVPVESNGRMEWWPSATLLSPCIIDVTYFPFDKQNCSLTIGPWGYHSEQVNYSLMYEQINLDSYTVSGAWELVNTSIRRRLANYPELNMSYTLVDISIQLKRKALYYWLNIIIPCLLLNSLGIGLFMLPADSGEKIGFGLGILLTVFVFAILVNENIPKTSDYTPIIGIYLVLIMCMISFSIFVAIVITDLHHRRPKLSGPPKWIKKLFLEKIAKVLGMKLPQLPLSSGFSMSNRRTAKKKQKLRLLNRMKRIKEQLDKENGKVANGDHKLHISETNTNGEATRLTDETSPQTSEHERLEEAYRNMPFDEMNNDEWILVALVLDRLSLFGFCFLLVVSSSLVLVVVPAAQNL